MRAVEQDATLLVLAFGDQLLRVGDQLGHQIALQVEQILDGSPVLLEHLVVAFGDGTGNNQRSPGVVDQHRVDLVDDRVVMLALHEILRRVRHIVAQVVETEFVVRAERDVGHVGLAPSRRVGLVPVDAVDRQSVKFVEGPHPFRVAPGQIVVDRHDVDALARQRVQEDRKRRDERLALAGRHLGYVALVQYDAAEKLAVVVHHVPCDLVASGRPRVAVHGPIAVDADEILRCGQLAVEVGGRHDDFAVFLEAPRRIFHDREGLGKNLLELLFDLFVDRLGQRVDLLRNAFLVFERSIEVLQLRFQIGDLLLVLADMVGDGRFERGAART